MKSEECNMASCMTPLEKLWQLPFRECELGSMSYIKSWSSLGIETCKNSTVSTSISVGFLTQI